jgi:serine/threonine protein kinase/WD40 repeat protein/tetratricopeptide (TPR) repeat protein
MSKFDSERYNLLDQLAEEFAERFRRGERPSIEEYSDRYPELADDIRELFPAMIKVEQVDGGQIDHENEAKPPGPKGPLQQIGDYRILGVIGRGGMGVVYEAEQVSLGRRVALKVLPRHVAADRVTLERFRREARAAARLHHTNIVPVFEVGQDGDTRFYAMQFIQGQSLDGVIAELRHLRIQSQSKASGEDQAKGGVEPRTLAPSVAHSILRGGFLPKGDVGTTSGNDYQRTAAQPTSAARALAKATAVGEEATEAGSFSTFAPQSSSSSTPTSLSWPVLPGGTQLSVAELSHRVFHRSVAHIGRQAAGALVHAHARGVIHRDIKPSNLLLDTDGVVWVTDFGLAKAEDDGLTQTGDVLGTIRYMAPERFSGQADPRSDVYALGLTLYELLVLRPAFDSPNRLALIEQVRSVDPPRPRSIDPRIPLDLETIVLKAVEKDAKARYASADAMSEDLRRFLADEPIQARQVGATERYWRWAKRNPMIATLGGVLTALLLAATVGSMLTAAYFKESARREANLAGREQIANQQSQRDRKDAIEARRLAIAERDHSRQLSAELALDKGFALAEEGHPDRGLLWMLEALKTAPDDAEGFRRMVRWNLGAWLGQVQKALKIIDTAGPCTDLAFSPDGKSFATGYTPFDHANATPIELWDTASGQKLRSLPGMFGPFAFGPDGKILFAHADERRMIAIDLLAGREIWTTAPLAGPYAARVNLSHDGSTVFAERNDSSLNSWLLRFDVVTGKERREPIQGWSRTATAPDGSKAATGRIENGKGYIDVHELPAGRRVASLRASKLGLGQLFFSPDAKSLYASVLEGDIYKGNMQFGQIWDLGTGRPTSPLLPGTSDAICTPAGDRLVTLTGDSWLVRDAVSGRAKGSAFPANGSAAAHPDGRTILAVADDNTIRVWQISADAAPVSGQESSKQEWNSSLGPNRQTRGLSVFWAGLRADGRVAISLAKDASERELILLSDPASGRPVGRPMPHYPRWVVRAVSVSPDGRCLATGSNPHFPPTGELRLWDASTGRLLLPPIPHTNYVSAIAFHPQGKLVATGDYNGLVRFWDTAIGREIGRPLPQGEIVMSLAFSPDGKILAVGLAMDHARKPGTRLWDTATREPIGDLLPSTDRVTRIEFRSDGQALLADTGRANSRLWDVPRGQPLGEPMVDEATGGFRPDGRAFLTVGKDGTVKLRDAATGELLARLLTASSPATCAAFRGDSGLLAAGFQDGTVRLCDPAASQRVGPPRSMRHAVQRVAFTPDGGAVTAVDEFGETRLWPVPEPLQDDDINDLTLRIEAGTGLRMQPGLAIVRQSGSAWRERIEQLGRRDPTALQLDDGPAWHEPMIREAEQKGNAFAAIWHLDCLLAVRSDDWFLYARRASAWSLSEKFEKAAADYEKAERLGSREQVLDYQTHHVIDCIRGERFREALWHLDRLIAARPDDGTLHEQRASVYGKLGREADRQGELARVFELGADAGLVLPRAEELGRAGRWAEAAGLLARCGRKNPVSRELAQAWGIACLKVGDRAGYREACAAVTARLGPDPTVVWNALSEAALLSLGPGAIEDNRVPIDWFEKRVSTSPAPPALYRHLLSNALAGLLLRAGRIAEAIARVNEGIAAAKEVELPTDWAYLALAHARKGGFAETRRWLDRLGAWRPDSSTSFWDLQELDLLRSEAEALVFDAEFPRNPIQGRRPR